MKSSILKLVRFAVIFSVTPAAVAATWYVNGVSGRDSNNCKSPLAACKTISHAISTASSGDSIMVGSAIYTENLTISISLNVTGSGASTTIVDGGGVNSVVTIFPTTTATVVLSGLTIRNGHAAAGAGVYNSGTLTITNTTISGNGASCALANSHSAGGGGISNRGTLTIYNSTISGNGASCSGVGGAAALGGGIDNGGTLTIKSSTIDGNSTAASAVECFRIICRPFSLGGGVFNEGSLTITNSTLTSNSARALVCHGPCDPYLLGGGIYNDNYGNAALSGSTLSGNRAALGAGIINCCSGSIVARNTIVANNSGGNCGGTVVSDGYNLSSDGTCNFNNSGDMNHIAPMLGRLQNNGGPTDTMALLPGSPAIDAGNPSGCTDGQGHLLKTDQRGMPRPNTEDKSGCDIGAYERQSD